MRFLGIDYGTKHVGIAISDERGAVAFPKAVLVNIPGVVDEIAALAQAEGVQGVVVGESRRADGGENALQREIVRFKHTLESALPGVSVSLQHEGMSTQSARVAPKARRGVLSRERRAPAAAARRREPADARAAAVILQRFLDRQSHTKS
ncbi:MAG: RuvX/YqgF family protein [bacterium]|nr:RuvX/YqgF family protein [bacterium]MDZ4284242.1 RuvX/YqgF family protein [Patescibacteria group bacterium]